MVGQEEDEIGLSHVYMFLVRDPFPCRCREGEYRIWMVATFHNENSSFEEINQLSLINVEKSGSLKCHLF